MNKKYLTLRQTANFLKVTNSVVNEMIKANIFQAVKKGNTYKIEKAEIEEWLAKLNEKETKKLALHKAACRFSDYFKPKYVFLDFEAANKFEAVAEMSKKAKELKIVRDHRWLYQVVIAREELVSTAVGKGVALLHPRHHHPSKIKTPAIIFGRSKDEIDFDALDNKPVKFFFMLLLHDDVQHLFSISYISKFLLHDENLEILRNATTTKEIVHALTPNFSEELKEK
jgi:excisionase family DNA binding protein